MKRPTIKALTEELEHANERADRYGANAEKEYAGRQTAEKELHTLQSNARADREEVQHAREAATHYKRQRDVLCGFIEADRCDRVVEHVQQSEIGAVGGEKHTYLDRFLNDMNNDYYPLVHDDGYRAMTRTEKIR